jgi:hypothetical protein
MKTVKRVGRQGEILFIKINKVPAGVTELPASKEGHIVGHSETGHHHVIDDKIGEVHHYASANPLLGYLSVDGASADVVHLRSFDTHETLRLGRGAWEIRRQREHTPEGWRQVAD